MSTDFLQVLRIVYETRLELESTESISNWTNQSVANRDISFPTEIVAKVDGKTYNVKLANGFQPARNGAGYNGESVDAAKTYASNCWSMYANKSAPMPAKEVCALLGYFVNNIVTGISTSYENSGKILFTKRILDAVKFQSLTIKIKMSLTESIIFNLSDVTSMVNGMLPIANRFLVNKKKSDNTAKHRQLNWSDSPKTVTARKPRTKKVTASDKPQEVTV